jgi:hypothetical protein
MAIIRITLPEDFDKRYKKYREKHVEEKMLEPFLIERLLQEKDNFLQITDEEEYQHEFDRWKPLKTIIDAIYKELSPLTEMAQNVKIDLEKLEISKNVASPILLTLVQEGVCRWRLDKGSAVISTVPINEYLKGNGIVIQDYKKFKDFKKEVSDFFNYVEQHRDQKFPKVKPPVLAKDFEITRQAQTKALETALEKGLEKEALKKEIVDEIKRVGKYGGEVVSDLPLIDYNETTGRGLVIGKKKFQFKNDSPEYNVFKMLYAKLGKKPAKLERLDVLVAGGFYPDHQQELDHSRKTAETACINDIAKNIREKTGLSTEEFVNNNGSLTLLALRQDKNPPKVTKFTPVWG